MFSQLEVASLAQLSTYSEGSSHDALSLVHLLFLANTSPPWLLPFFLEKMASSISRLPAALSSFPQNPSFFTSNEEGARPEETAKAGTIGEGNNGGRRDAGCLPLSVWVRT